MKLLTKTYFFLLIFAAFTLKAQAQFFNEDSYFSERSKSECTNSDPELTSWYFNNTTELPKVLQRLGPIRDQGATGQCYAMTAADLISEKWGKRVSSKQVAHLYYQKSIAGGIQKIFGSNQGGHVGSALRASQNQKLCIEPQDVPLITDPDLKSNPKFCENPEFKIPSFSVGNESTAYAKGHVLFKQMDTILNKKKIVGASYLAQIVFPYFQVSVLNSFANHASTIVARQWNPHTQSCDYVIRNSWGSRCYNSVGNCKLGYYSIAEKYLDQAIQKIDWIKH